MEKSCRLSAISFQLVRVAAHAYARMAGAKTTSGPKLSENKLIADG
jgi:hypothetical protein